MDRLSFPRVDSWEDSAEPVDAWAPWGERNLSPSPHGLAFLLICVAHFLPQSIWGHAVPFYIDVSGLNRAARAYKRGVGLFLFRIPIRPPPINYISAKAYHMARHSRNMGLYRRMADC